MSDLVAGDKMMWLKRLHSFAPECAHTEGALHRLQEQHPSLEVDEATNTALPPSGFKRIEQEWAWSADDPLSHSPGEWIDALTALHETDPSLTQRQSTIKSVEEAAAKSGIWGVTLANALVERENWDSPFWEALLHAWETDIGAENIQHALSHLLNPNVHRRNTMSTARVLTALVTNGGRAYAPALLGNANRLASVLWPYAAADIHPPEPFDWLTLAINRSVGPLTQYWLGSLSIGLREGRLQRGRLVDPYRTALDSIAQDQTAAGRMGRAVLMTAFAFLLSVDEDWTRQHLVPQLTEPLESENAQAQWDGLMYGQLSVDTIEVLTKPFQSAAANVQGLQAPHTREQFVAYLVGLLIDFVDDPITEWIPGFLLNAEGEDRQRFAWAIWKRLGDMTDVEQRELWDRWLQRYWENRIDGVPSPLEDVETEWMQNWLTQLHSLFAQGVEVALKMPSRGEETFLLISELKNGDQCEREPNAVVDLLVRVANSESASPPLFHWPNLIERLTQSDLTNDRRESLQELQVRLGLS